MKTDSVKPFEAMRLITSLFVAAALWLLFSFAANAATLVIEFRNSSDGAPITVEHYRWTVEQDATKASIPGRPADSSNYSFSFHTSYMPVVAAGRVRTQKLGVTADPDVDRLYNQALPEVCPAATPGVCLDPAKRYYLSIAADDYQMGGAPVVFGPGGSATAVVYLNPYPLPTAQVSVFAFNDNSPINGAPDLPQELGLAGFHVHLLEAGGTYGQSGGEVTQDAFANPLGTTYNSDGSVLKKGDGIVKTDANGVAVIKNLFPAKYTVVIVPPVGSDWVQTSTIEGGKGQDAWVKNNEPSFFQEFGPPGHHVFIGFVRPGCVQGPQTNGRCNGLPAGTGRTITGRVIDTHNSRPPVYTFFHGAPVTNCWTGLNDPATQQAIYATACRKDSTFSIPNIPAGTYELVIWDEPLDVIISTTTITVAASNLALGDLPVSSWFGRYQGRVFQDIDGTGLPFFNARLDRPHIEVDPVTGVESEVTKSYAAGDLKPPFGEGIASNIRFRDGSIYQSTTTKKDGTFAFTEVFPFFNWMIAEIDYARFKATGATIVADDGGLVDPAANAGGAWNSTTGRFNGKLWNAEKGSFGSNDPAITYDPWTRLNPQCQEYDAATPPNCTKYYRTENCADGDGQCAILLEGMQTFLGQTNHIEWGKQPYNGTANHNGLIGENGGIAGIVHYAITRAEDDPRFAAAENWEPGIPRVQVNLFLDCDGDGKPDKPAYNGTGQCAAGGLSSGTYVYEQPDIDNYPFCWRDAEFAAGNSGLCPNGQAMGPEDVMRVRDRTTAAAEQSTWMGRTVVGSDFLYGDVFRWGAPNGNTTAQDQIGLGKTDSWDDSVPTGCPDSGGQYRVPGTGEALDCFDGLRNFNQVRPSVFDGGYAFGRVAGQPELPMFIGAEGKGTYIVEAVAPPGYLHQGNGDKNVVFGDALSASTAALPFECVGRELPVPEYLTLFPGERNPNFDAGQTTWRKCDMKAVPLVPGANPAPDFYMFTEAPVAGHGVGFILDDTAAEFNHFAPNFGEKYSPPHLPVSVQDWNGREISRVYSDQFGSYNFLVPSSFTINPPYPSGVMPSMMVACMNHPGPITHDPATGAAYAQPQLDPYYNRSYSTFCYTLQYLPGKTTYLDTPVLPIAAFAPVDKNPLDCNCADGTPGIFSANHGTDDGPWVPSAGATLSIVSQGAVDVVNPAFDPNVVLGTAPVPPVPGVTYVTDPNDVRLKKTIQRDYGFGDPKGAVLIDGAAIADANVIWNSADLITVTVPNLGTGAHQLSIRRGDNGKESVVGITVHVGGSAPIKVNANATAGTPGVYKTIQAAIDAAPAAGALITVAPGTYNEYVIMDKHIELQGWGAGSVTINAAKSSAGGLAAWRALLNSKINPVPDGTINPDTGQPNLVPGPGRTFDLLPGQTLGVNPANNEPLLFGAEEGPGVLVVGRMGGSNNNPNPAVCRESGANFRVDGLTITGSDAGGGILASGYACNLKISNNRVAGNYGTYGGGIRVGHTVLLDVDNSFSDGVNRTPSIHHNWISQNGSTEAGGGGGVTLGTGSNGYTVADNYVCGNFSMADGGGLSHLGTSPGANAILRNKFLFNQTFNQSADPMGGGLSIAGQIPVGGGAQTGTGDVTVNANLFQGNQAGAGAGGAVNIARSVSGNNANNTDDIVLTNNMIVNNVAAYAGGGVSMTGNGSGVRLVNNTIASNVSTATGRQAFGPQGPAQPSLPQIAGVAVLDGSSPGLLNNIIWGNRQYIYLISGTTTGLFNPGTASVAAPNNTASYSDLGRVAGAGTLTPTNSVFTTGATGFTSSATNRFVAATAGTSLFTAPIDFLSIVDPTQPVVLQDSTVALQSALTFDETGNFINVIFSPLTAWNASGTAPRADYHLTASSPAMDTGAARTGGNGVPTTDYDGDGRLSTTANPIDIGADEVAGSVAPPTLPALALLDDFNRANASTLGASWSQVTSNSNLCGLLGGAPCAIDLIRSNQATSVSLIGLAANAYWNGPINVFGASQGAAFTFASVGNNAALVLKASQGSVNAPTRYVRVRYTTTGTDRVIVETTTNGVTFAVQGAAMNTAFANGDTFIATVSSSGLVTVWRNSTQLGSVQLPTTGANTWTTSTGRIGMQLPTFGTTVDNFAGGTVTP